MKKQQRTPITVSPTAKPVTLAPNYGVDHGRYSLVNAYCVEGQARKQQFLKDGQRFMRAVGQALTAYGFTEMSVRANRGGLAVSGEVYAEFFHPDLQQWLYMWIQASALPSMSGRRDGMLLTARWHEATRSGSTRMGPNCPVTIRSSTEVADDAVRAVFPQLLVDGQVPVAPTMTRVPTSATEQAMLFAA